MAERTFLDWPFFGDEHRQLASDLESWCETELGRAHAVTKKQLDAEWHVSVEDALELEARAQARCMQTRDFHRAYEAFANKRTPEFQGD